MIDLTMKNIFKKIKEKIILVPAFLWVIVFSVFFTCNLYTNSIENTSNSYKETGIGYYDDIHKDNVYVNKSKDVDTMLLTMSLTNDVDLNYDDDNNFVFQLIIALFASIIGYFVYRMIYIRAYNVSNLPIKNIVEVTAISTLYFGMIFLGTLAFIIPGLIIGVIFCPINYVMVKYPDLSIKESFEKAYYICKNNILAIIGYDCLFVIISFILALFAEQFIAINYLYIILIAMLQTFEYILGILLNIILFEEMDK